MGNSKKVDAGDRRQFLIVMVAVVIITVGFFGKGLLPSGEDEAAPEATGADSGDRKIKYWQGPMNPSYHSDKPGKSPMGMDLVPVYEGSSSGVVVASGVQQSIGVRTAIVKNREITRSISTVGRVDYDERRIYKVETKTAGWVEKLYVDFEGHDVRKGDYLLELYSPELVSTSEEYIIALNYRDSLSGSSVASGEGLLKSARRRLELFDVPEHQIKEMEKTREAKKTLHIHSPATGVVVKMNVLAGMHIKPGVPLYTIADLSRVWVLADIYETDVPWVKKGQKVAMTIKSLPGQKFYGKVTYIYPYMQEQTRTVKVRMEFNNKKMQLKPDMYAEVDIHSSVRRYGVTVPKEAVIHSGADSMLLIAKGKGEYEPRLVHLGIEAEDYYEVLSGVQAGEEIVTSANFLLDSEANLREVVSKMGDGSGKPMTGMANPCAGDMKGMKGMKHGDMKGMANPCAGDMKGMKGMKHGDMKGMANPCAGDMKGMKGMKHMDHSAH